MIRKFALALLASSALTVPVQVHAQDLPSGGLIAAGSATISTAAPGAMTITQASDRAIINWQSFSVGSNNRIDIAQPSSTSALLNRVAGTATSTIAGQINANGQVLLVNPNGILITATGSVRAAGFVASTLDLGDRQFMSGDITVTGNRGSVINDGTISVVKGGFAALLGGRVDNHGLIRAPLGTVALGSGTRATLDLTGDGFLQVAMPTVADGGITMAGRISADGGSVILSAATALDAARHMVNLSGTIEARGVSGHNGSVVLTGSAITLAGATIDVSGASAGGSVRIGGGRMGGGSLAHAATVGIDAGSRIDASATGAGNGGDVVVWSDTVTQFAGTIDARGVGGGTGGNAEVSSHGRLAYTGTSDLTGNRFGTLLLDPYDVTISTGADSNHGAFAATGSGSVINATTLTNALGLANVTVSTGSSGTQAGTITVAAPLTWASTATLTLQAADAIALNDDISAAAGGLTLSAGGAIGATGSVSVGRFTLAGGDWAQNAATLPGFAAADFAISGGSFLRVRGGDGTSGSPYLVDDVYGLQGIGSTSALLGSNWQLAGDIDATGTAGWNGRAGFVPIGNLNNHFRGMLDGAGHVVGSLTIDRPSTDGVGLVGYLGHEGQVNVGMVGGSFRGRFYVGSLVGYNMGTIGQSYATGAVTGSYEVGGLVGYNAGGSIGQSYASGVVSGGTDVGGLVGYSYNGTVTQSYATGAVTGLNDVGGMVGVNINSTVTESYWDVGTTGQATSGGGTGLTTAQARDQRYYSGFDFTNVWYQMSDLRPILRSEAATAVGGVIGVSNLHQLQLIGANLGANYRLTADIDATATGGTDAAGIFGTAGFVPIGNLNNAFTGMLDGAGHAVSGLMIDRPSAFDIGLVGYLGTDGQIIHVGIVGGSITGGSIVGGLVGWSQGTIRQSYATGTVSSDYSTGYFIGGLVGYTLGGTVSQSYATGAVTGLGYVGGLIGYASGPVSQSYAVGAVSGQNNVGGLVGVNYGMLTQSYWDMDTTGQNASAGGLGLATAQMQDVTQFRTLFAGFGFDTVWAPPSDAAYSSDGMAHYPELYALSRIVAATAGSGTRVYGDAAATLTAATYVGLHIGDSLTTPGTDSLSNLTNVGTYSNTLTGVTAKAASGVDYRIVSVPGAEIVTPRALTITPDGVPRLYGDGNPTSGTAMGDGFVNGDTVMHVDLATSAGLASHVGSYDLSASAAIGTGLGNYTISYAPRMGGLSVTPRLVSITADTLDRIYGDANPQLTWTVGDMGLANGDMLSGSLATTAELASTIGPYAIDQGTLAASSDYIVTSYTSALLTVTPRELTITPDGVPRVYGDANPASGTATGDGFVNGDTVMQVELATSAGLASHVGSYDLSASAAIGVGLENYTISYAPRMDGLSVTPRYVSITADTLDRIYGDANPQLTWTVGDMGLANGDMLSGSLETTAELASSIGPYAIDYGTLAVSSDYFVSSYTSALLTVTPRALTITPDALDRIYGDVNPTSGTATGSAFVNGDTVTQVALATPAGLASHVGSYDLTALAAIGTGLENYTISYAPRMDGLSVTPRALTIAPDALSRVYGDANPTSGAATGNAFVNGDTVTQVVLSTPATSASHVGSYDLSASAATGTGLGNYTISYAPLTNGLSVTPRIVSIAADALDRIYGNANPPLTWTVGGIGLANNDRLSGSLATAAGLASSIGTYAIGQGTLAASSDYSITGYTSALLTVMPRALTITPDALTRTYGNANPTSGTATGDNFANGDTVTQVALATSAGLTSHVGSYDLNASAATGTGLGNYAISYAPQTGGLSVTPRPVSIAADTLGRNYGDANPQLTWTVGSMGLVNGDRLSGSLATTAGLASTVGNYAIQQGTLAVSQNYNLNFVTGTLTIHPFFVADFANVIGTVARITLPSGLAIAGANKTILPILFSNSSDYCPVRIGC